MTLFSNARQVFNHSTNSYVQITVYIFLFGAIVSVDELESTPAVPRR